MNCSPIRALKFITGRVTNTYKFQLKNHQNSSNVHSHSNGNSQPESTQTSNNDVSTDERQYAVLLKKCSFARNPKIPVTLTPSQSRTNASLVDISLAIKRGEMVGVIGGMASGKSTLMSGRVDMVVEFYVQGNF